MSYNPNHFPGGGEDTEVVVPPQLAEWVGNEPGVQEIVANLQRLGNKPGLLEAVFNRTEDQEILSDPSVQLSIRQMEAGDVVELEVPEE